MTQEKRDAIAEKCGLAKTDLENEYIGTKLQWENFEKECSFVEEMERDFEPDYDQILKDKEITQ